MEEDIARELAEALDTRIANERIERRDAEWMPDTEYIWKCAQEYFENGDF